jgi:hypothetical protein
MDPVQKESLPLSNKNSQFSIFGMVIAFLNPAGFGYRAHSRLNKPTKQNQHHMKNTVSMFKSATLAVLLASASASGVHAGTYTAPPTPVSEAPESAFGLDLVLTSDTFFGFVPAAFGSYSITDTFDFTAYGIFWSGGTGGNWGNWTEFGLGFAYNPTSALSINPAVGILGGSLLSNSAFGPGVLGDGYVPNITIGLDTDKFEGEIYFGAYLPLESRSMGTLEFLHYWANLGYKVSSFFSFGGHYEQLTGGATATSSTIYTWVGPYIQFAEPTTGVALRFAGGVDLQANDSFYKLSLAVSF